jgi:hypothetical protein
MSTAVRCASDSDVEGCPLPAEVVISTESFPNSMAFLCMDDAKLMLIPCLLPECGGFTPGG